MDYTNICGTWVTLTSMAHDHTWQMDYTKMCGTWVTRTSMAHDYT
jgi:hypothetical protein